MEEQESILYGEDFENASALIQRGYGYWKTKAGTRPAPTWRDIKPAEIKDLLPDLVVIHVLQNPLDFVERITGERIIEKNHGNSMGIYWRQIPGRGPGSRIWASLEDVVSYQKPSFQTIPYIGPHKDFLRVQTITCPISDDVKTVNKMLGFIDYLRR